MNVKQTELNAAPRSIIIIIRIKRNGACDRIIIKLKCKLFPLFYCFFALCAVPLTFCCSTVISQFGSIKFIHL